MRANGEKPASGLMAMGFAALGVVFGDIGTSPLYTLKTVLALTGERPDPGVTLGALSLVVWTLVVVTTIKYVTIAMRIDNDGEGGILALMALLGIKRERREKSGRPHGAGVRGARGRVRRHRHEPSLHPQDRARPEP